MFFKSIVYVAICFVLSCTEAHRRHRIDSHRLREVEEASVEESYHESPRLISPSHETHNNVQDHEQSWSDTIYQMIFTPEPETASASEEGSILEPSEEIGTTQDQNAVASQNEHMSRNAEIDDGDADMANPCGRGNRCANKAEEKTRRVEILKKTLLKKLRLDMAPNITNQTINRNSSAVKGLFKKYDHAKKIAELDVDKVSTKQIVHTAISPPFYTPKSTVSWFYFPFTRKETENFEVESATLSVYVRPKTTNATRAVVEVTDYRMGFNETVEDVDVFSDKRRALKVEVNKQVWNGFWIKIRLTDIVTRWVQDPTKNFGVDISSTDLPDLIATGRDPEKENFTPYLNVKLMVSASQRKKRSALLGCNSIETLCCLRDFDVTFEEIGWGWIIAPSHMNLKYCGGECGVNQLSNPHATFIRHTNVGTAEQKKTCCVPNALAPMSMLYYDHQSTIIYNEIPQMVIDSCDCL